MTKRNLHDLLSAGYLNQKQAAEKLKSTYDYDHDLSNNETKVFINKETNKPVIVHRGSKRLSDWVDNAKIAVGLGKYSNRLQKSNEIAKKVNQKYGNHDAVGHSLGGYLAENT